MRRFIGCLCLTLAALAGCKNGMHREPHPPAAAGPTPTVEQLVNHLNHHARAISAIQADRVTVAVKDGIKSFNVTGRMAYEKPRNFRLMAAMGGKTVADVGSNGEEFWFWFKDQQDGLAYCSYDDLPRVRLTLPIHPDWIAEALCVGEFGPPQQYQLRAAGGNLELTSPSITPQGQRVVKTTIVANAGQNRGRIIGHRLRDERGNEIWSADINSYQQADGFVVPRVVTIRQGDQKAEFTLTLGDVRVNGNNVGPDMYRRPNYGNEINLARGASPLGSPQSLNKARGSSE